jgi:hypothetical protein
VRKPNADANGNSDSNPKPNGNGDADGYAYIHTKAYAYAEGCTNAETASDAGATSSVRHALAEWPKRSAALILRV